MAKKDELGKNLALGGISRIKTKKKLIDTSLEDAEEKAKVVKQQPPKPKKEKAPEVPKSVLKPKHSAKKKKYRDGEEVKAVNIEFPVSLWEQVKMRAFKDHYTFKGIILRAAKYYLAAKEEEDKNRIDPI